MLTFPTVLSFKKGTVVRTPDAGLEFASRWKGKTIRVWNGSVDEEAWVNGGSFAQIDAISPFSR